MGQLTHCRILNIILPERCLSGPSSRSMSRHEIDNFLSFTAIYGDLPTQPFPSCMCRGGRRKWLLLGVAVGVDLLTTSGLRGRTGWTMAVRNPSSRHPQRTTWQMSPSHHGPPLHTHVHAFQRAGLAALPARTAPVRLPRPPRRDGVRGHGQRGRGRRRGGAVAVEDARLPPVYGRVRSKRGEGDLATSNTTPPTTNSGGSSGGPAPLLPDRPESLGRTRWGSGGGGHG